MGEYAQEGHFTSLGVKTASNRAIRLRPEESCEGRVPGGEKPEQELGGGPAAPPGRPQGQGVVWRVW